MNRRANDHGFMPPPHANARPHRRVMAALEKMSPEQALALSVEAGIHTPDGQLTAAYKPAEDRTPNRRKGEDQDTSSPK